jgi:xylulose-5-phosphate/fructose-6-phosphate phosphoketolase
MKGYKPEELFNENSKLIEELKELAPTGNSRISANPISNRGLLRRPLTIPDFREYRFKDIAPSSTVKGGIANIAKFLRNLVAYNINNFRLFGPDETESNKLSKVYKAVRRSI